jgi:hypothetical protein
MSSNANPARTKFWNRSTKLLPRVKTSRAETSTKGKKLSTATGGVSQQQPKSGDIGLQNQPDIHPSTSVLDTVAIQDRPDVARIEEVANNRGTQVPGGGETVEEDPDTLRTRERYEKATKALKQALEVRRNDWKSLEFTGIDKFSENGDATILQTEINNVLEARKNSIKNKTGWEKCKGIVERMFKTLSPFAKTFLNVATRADAVRQLTSAFLTVDGHFQPVRDTLRRSFVVDNSIEFLLPIS